MISKRLAEKTQKQKRNRPKRKKEHIEFPEATSSLKILSFKVNNQNRWLHFRTKNCHLLTYETIFLKLVSDITRLVQELLKVIRDDFGFALLLAQEPNVTSLEANEATRIFLNHDLPQKRDWLWFCS